ncbi:hypothetical protein AAFF_G00280130 [Aldrovandia affinis]|uniref:Uncharacterized protein n=1 Tax=Aldrovandia affinis TaxID=143900 RepID=A0AAD7RA08_9TELE|nr:hypothetical protein AAFF_G00280130 [Aldrovandia affinis]
MLLRLRGRSWLLLTCLAGFRDRDEVQDGCRGLGADRTQSRPIVEPLCPSGPALHIPALRRPSLCEVRQETGFETPHPPSPGETGCSYRLGPGPKGCEEAQVSGIGPKTP